jgi:hypothetical protein
MCPGVTVSETLDLTGTVTFSPDKTYTVSETFSASATFTLPIACLDGGACQDLKPNGFTVAQQGTSCVLTTAQAPADAGPAMTSSSGTWSTSGNSLVTMQADSGPSTSMDDFCVSGNGTTLTVRSTDSKGGVVIYNATKQ